MHLVYRDHAGEVMDSRKLHAMMGGIACFARQTHWISEEPDQVAKRFAFADPASVRLRKSVACMACFIGRRPGRRHHVDDVRRAHAAERVANATHIAIAATIASATGFRYAAAVSRLARHIARDD
jgi:hypothetical protein